MLKSTLRHCVKYTYRAEKTIKSVSSSFLTYFQAICKLIRPLWIRNYDKIHATKGVSSTLFPEYCKTLRTPNTAIKIS